MDGNVTFTNNTGNPACTSNLAGAINLLSGGLTLSPSNQSIAIASAISGISSIVINGGSSPAYLVTLSGTTIILAVVGSNPVWTGAVSSEWSDVTLANPKN